MDGVCWIQYYSICLYNLLELMLGPSLLYNVLPEPCIQEGLQVYFSHALLALEKTLKYR